MSETLHDRLVDSLGADIVEGRISPGTVILTDDLVARYGVSRSVVREAVRVVRSFGLVTSIKRIGIRVLDRSAWNMLDPTVIGWRLAGSDRGAQLRSLTELRTAVEPLAAGLAARRADPDVIAELNAVTGRMTAAGESGDVHAFLELDIRFHHLVIAASGNEMLAPMGAMVEAVLRGRTALGLQPTHPHPGALHRHGEVAAAVAAGDPATAAEAMRAIVNRTMLEVEHVWGTTEPD